jgi:hypothetical protein
MNKISRPVAYSALYFHICVISLNNSEVFNKINFLSKKKKKKKKELKFG